MKKIIVIILTTLILITGCVSYDFARRIVTQGNLLPESKLKRLHIGMSKDDVAILMGQSLLEPTFNNNRWDYAYTWRKGTNGLKQKHVVLYFKNNSLIRIQND
jgi:outer membrane protein assembly factor BamE